MTLLAKTNPKGLVLATQIQDQARLRKPVFLEPQGPPPVLQDLSEPSNGYSYPLAGQ
ncbi:hypothetical protein [Aliiroseovarius pelagivivens]|uniref:hypothetical protein n=1 Tax=Aliiroseovarius pelagivivens TaxID=1639690 RepID=UPI002795267F|nr:hypothetical protein [Aliiroseovarius pelagivivens]